MSKSIAEETLDLQRQMRTTVPSELLAQFQQDADALGRAKLEERALKVGALAPDFTLPDAHGRAVRLSELLTRGPVVVSFYRGSWCPYCNLQLRAYQRSLGAIQALGAQLVAISPQQPDHPLSFEEKNELTFPVLSDAHNSVARAYGLVFQVPDEQRGLYRQVGSDLERYNGDSSWELPVPGTFVVDRNGRIAYAFVDGDYVRRAETRDILDVLRRLAAPLHLSILVQAKSGRESALSGALRELANSMRTEGPSLGLLRYDALGVDENAAQFVVQESWVSRSHFERFEAAPIEALKRFFDASGSLVEGDVRVQRLHALT